MVEAIRLSGHLQSERFHQPNLRERPAFRELPFLPSATLWRVAAERISKRISIDALQPTCSGMIPPNDRKLTFRQQKSGLNLSVNLANTDGRRKCFTVKRFTKL